MMQSDITKVIELLKGMRDHCTDDLSSSEIERYHRLLSKVEGANGPSMADFRIDIDEYRTTWVTHDYMSDPEAVDHVPLEKFKAKLLPALEFLQHELAQPVEAEEPGEVDVELLCRRLGHVARELMTRYNGRAAFEISDEYDTQDLLRALLHVHFDDIRREEYTPSYAGKATKMDFLIQEIGVVIEVKFAHAPKDGGRIGDEVSADVSHYNEHPRCKRLFVLIHDPKHLLQNPVGMVRDLEKLSCGGSPIRVIYVTLSH